jgi:hypothetical protein
VLVEATRDEHGDLRARGSGGAQILAIEFERERPASTLRRRQLRSLRLVRGGRSGPVCTLSSAGLRKLLCARRRESSTLGGMSQVRTEPRNSGGRLEEPGRLLSQGGAWTLGSRSVSCLAPARVDVGPGGFRPILADVSLALAMLDA